MKRDHRPQRTCLGCGEKDEQQSLLRLVVGGGELKIERRAQGRGGYLHWKERCWGAFLRRKNLYRTFRVEVSRQAREKLISTLRERIRE